MTSWRSRVRLGAYSLLFTLTLASVLAGCGTGDPDTSDVSDDGAESRTSPLDEYLGDGMFRAGGGFAVTHRIGGDGDEQKERQVEDAVATCMRDQGFEYVPYTPDDSVAEAFEEAESLPPDEYARQYGYGISTIGFGATDDDEDQDPNDAIRSALSESAAEAYDQALWGDMGGGMAIVQHDGEDGDESGPGLSELETGEPGCKQTAREEIYGEPERRLGDDLSAFDELFENLRALEERITSDPDMVAAVDAWSGCMADAGHPGQDTLDAPQMAITGRMSELLGVPGPEGPTDDATVAPGDDSAGDDAGGDDAGGDDAGGDDAGGDDAGGDDAGGDDAGGDDAGGDDAGGDDAGGDDAGPAGAIRVDPSQIDEEELAKLREDEIAVAVADRECRAEHVDPVELEVRDAMESEFVDANRDILEQYRDAMAGSTS